MRPLLASLCLLSALAACRSVDTTGQRSNGFAAPDRSMVYDAVLEALRQQGFTPDSSASSETAGVVISRHRLSMAPFSGQGYREKATMKIADVADHPGYFTVEANVLREYNDNIEQPSNPIVADWRKAERVPEKENLLKSLVEMRFVAPGASTQFRQDRGLRPEGQGRLEGLSTDAPPDYHKGPFFPK